MNFIREFSLWTHLGDISLEFALLLFWHILYFVVCWYFLQEFRHVRPFTPFPIEKCHLIKNNRSNKDFLKCHVIKNNKINKECKKNSAKALKLNWICRVLQKSLLKKHNSILKILDKSIIKPLQSKSEDAYCLNVDNHHDIIYGHALMQCKFCSWYHYETLARHTNYVQYQSKWWDVWQIDGDYFIYLFIWREIWWGINELWSFVCLGMNWMMEVRLG